MCLGWIGDFLETNSTEICACGQFHSDYDFRGNKVHSPTTENTFDVVHLALKRESSYEVQPLKSSVRFSKKRGSHPFHHRQRLNKFQKLRPGWCHVTRTLICFSGEKICPQAPSSSSSKQSGEMLSKRRSIPRRNFPHPWHQNFLRGQLVDNLPLHVAYNTLMLSALIPLECHCTIVCLFP